jgi:hypothetical protein
LQPKDACFMGGVICEKTSPFKRKLSIDGCKTSPGGDRMVTRMVQ